MTLLLKSSSSGGPIYCVYQHSTIWLLPMFKYWPRIPMKKSFFDNLQTHASPFLEDLKSSAKYYNVWNLSVSCLSIFSLLRIMTGVIINDENDELLFLVWFFLRPLAYLTFPSSILKQNDIFLKVKIDLNDSQWFHFFSYCFIR